MKDYTNIEATSHLLLKSLEDYIVNGRNLTGSVIIAMNDLKKALDDSNDKMGADLEAIMKQYKNNLTN